MTACWTDPREDRTGLEWWEEHPAAPATCLLPDGHDGPHEFTPDSEITVTFGRTPTEEKGASDVP